MIPESLRLEKPSNPACGWSPPCHLVTPSDTSRFLQGSPFQGLSPFSMEEFFLMSSLSLSWCSLGLWCNLGKVFCWAWVRSCACSPSSPFCKEKPNLNSRKCQENYVNLQSEFSSGPQRSKWMLLLLLLVFYHWGNPGTIRWTRWRSQCQREKKKKCFLADVGGLLTWGF